VAGQAVSVIGAGVQLSGTSFHHTIAADDPVKVAIRPEDIKIVDNPTSQSFTATVEVSEYRGSSFALDASTSTGQVLYLLADRGFAPGTPVNLEVDPNRALVYPVELAEAVAQVEAVRP